MQHLSPVDALIADLDADRQRLAAAVSRIPMTMRNRRPAPDRWSTAEILEHLVIVEQRAAGIVRELAATAPAEDESAGSRPPGVFDRTMLRDRTRRVAAPEQLHPTGQWDAEQTWTKLEESRGALLEAIREARGRDLNAVTRKHPRLGTLTGYEWIAALGGHEERHVAQIEEIADWLVSEKAPNA